MIIHCIGISGIGLSALARHYKHAGHTVSGSSDSDSELLEKLRAEGISIQIGHQASNVPEGTDLVVHTEAIALKPGQIDGHPEIIEARSNGIRILTYPQALAEAFDAKKGIAVCGSHGKSTTTAMLGMAFESVSPTIIVGTQVPQFGGSNFLPGSSEWFGIEACEYRRSFLAYHPFATIITNIDLDHLDYYRDLPDYLDAFQEFVDQTSGFVVVPGHDSNCRSLDIPPAKKILVFPDSYEHLGETHSIPDFVLQVPGEHLKDDARLVYALGSVLGIDSPELVRGLESYRGSWRRSELVKTTENGNLLFSDYGHHPNEIAPTLTAIHAKYPDKKLIVAFQPHQYSRTRELLDGFATCFVSADTVIIPDIYRSRDTDEDVASMPVSKLMERIAETHGDVSG